MGRGGSSAVKHLSSIHETRSPSEPTPKVADRQIGRQMIFNIQAAWITWAKSAGKVSFIKTDCRPQTKLFS